MYVVCIHVHVQPEHRDEFIQASLANARATVKEPGNLRFDVNRQVDDPDRFVLVRSVPGQGGDERPQDGPLRRVARRRGRVDGRTATRRQTRRPVSRRRIAVGDAAVACRQTEPRP